MLPSRRLLALTSVLLAMTNPFLHAQEDTTKTPAPAGGAPVVFADDTLFSLHARIGPFSPQDRARAITQRMSKLSQDPLARIDTLVTSMGETSTDILSGDIVIMSVFDADAAAAGLTRQQMVQDFTQKIYAALQKQSSRTSLKSILLGILFTLIATFVLIFVFRVLNSIFPKIYAKFNTWRGTRIPSLKIQKLEVLSSDRITELLIGLMKAVRLTAVLLLLYFYLPLVFSFFPWTRGLAGTLFGYILSPVNAIWRGVLSYLPNIFFIAVIATVTHYTIRTVRWLFREIAKGTITLPGFHRDWAEPTFKIARFLIIAFAAIVVFPYLPGSGSPAFQSVSVFLGVLFSLGSASAIANVVSGVVLTYTRAFSVGDRVKIADTVGDVIEKTLLITRVRTIKNVDITIPNAMVLGSHIVNFSSSAQARGLILHTSVTIGYDVPWKKVHELLIAAAKSTPHVLPEPAPFVLQTGLNDFYVSYELNAYTEKPGMMAKIYSELHQNIQDKFNEACVEIMSPHYSAMRDGNMTTIPENYLPKTYAPPSFRILPFGNLSPKPDEKAAPDRNK